MTYLSTTYLTYLKSQTSRHCPTHNWQPVPDWNTKLTIMSDMCHIGNVVIFTKTSIKFLLTQFRTAYVNERNNRIALMLSIRHPWLDSSKRHWLGVTVSQCRRELYRIPCLKKGIVEIVNGRSLLLSWEQSNLDKVMVLWRSSLSKSLYCLHTKIKALVKWLN